MTSERFSFQNQIEHLHQKYLGTGNADLTKWEWGTSIARDSLASHVGHYDRMVYFSVAENENVSRLRIRFLEKMVRPCGPPPPDILKKKEFLS